MKTLFYQMHIQTQYLTQAAVIIIILTCSALSVSDWNSIITYAYSLRWLEKKTNLLFYYIVLCYTNIWQHCTTTLE